jgi:AhpD family alkylhydroperoxidase
LLAADVAIEQTGIEKPLLELVGVRASQINGCAFCIDMHTKDAVPAAKGSSGFTLSALGVRRRSFRIGSERRWRSRRQ